MTGLFITFEGGEGVGKSTQILRLAEAFQKKGYKVFQTREPGGTPEAEKIRELLLKSPNHEWDPLSETLLLSAARHEHLKNAILPALERGEVVLCDRFADSTLAYQGYAGGLSFNVIDTLYQLTVGMLEPDLTLLFDLSIEEGFKRTHKRGEVKDHFEIKDKMFHEKLRAGFLEIARQNPKRVYIIDASNSIQNVFEHVLEAILNRLKIDLFSEKRLTSKRGS